MRINCFVENIDNRNDIVLDRKKFSSSKKCFKSKNWSKDNSF